MIRIENDFLFAEIHSQGAELQKLCLKSNNRDFIWRGDPSYWGKHSPILFPIVGALKDNSYFYKGQKYTLPRHGFARDQRFELIEHQQQKASFLLRSSEETKKHYPFDFELRITYSLKQQNLEVSYEVYNPAAEILYFSIGAHPAFAIPFNKHSDFEDYAIRFPKDQKLHMRPLESGLLAAKEIEMDLDTHILPLSHKLFEDDALILQKLKSNTLEVFNTKCDTHFKFSYSNFEYFGIWSTKQADFVCLEPWNGLADSVNHNQHLEEKLGIRTLKTEEKFSCAWTIKTN